MSEHIQWQELHELLKELAQKEYGDKYGEQIFWYFQDVIDDSCKLDVLEEENERLHSIIKEVREYITSYESIETLNQVEHNENNKGLNKDTMIEMINRHLKVHNKVLEILDKENE